MYFYFHTMYLVTVPKPLTAVTQPPPFTPAQQSDYQPIPTTPPL